MKILINACYGGFHPSKHSRTLYKTRTGKTWDDYQASMRTDPVMIQILQENGEIGRTRNMSRIELVEIPDQMAFKIEEMDGAERVRVVPPPNWRSLSLRSLRKVMAAMERDY